MSPRKENAKQKYKYKPAAVFPLVEDPPPPSSFPVEPCFPASFDSMNWERNSGMDAGEDEVRAEREDKDRIFSLRDLPMWVSVSVPSGRARTGRCLF